MYGLLCHGYHYPISEYLTYPTFVHHGKGFQCIYEPVINAEKSAGLDFFVI